MRNMMLSLMILLVSCVKIPYHPLKDVRIILHEDGSIDLDRSRCRVRCYNYNKLNTVDDDKCGEDFRSGNFSLVMCNQVLATDLAFFAEEIKPAINFFKREFNDCRNRDAFDFE